MNRRPRGERRAAPGTFDIAAWSQHRRGGIRRSNELDHAGSSASWPAPTCRAHHAVVGPCSPRPGHAPSSPRPGRHRPSTSREPRSAFRSSWVRFPRPGRAGTLVPRREDLPCQGPPPRSAWAVPRRPPDPVRRRQRRQCGGLSSGRAVAVTAEPMCRTGSRLGGQWAIITERAATSSRRSPMGRELPMDQDLLQRLGRTVGTRTQIHPRGGLGYHDRRLPGRRADDVEVRHAVGDHRRREPDAQHHRHGGLGCRAGHAARPAWQDHHGAPTVAAPTRRGCLGDHGGHPVAGSAGPPIRGRADHARQHAGRWRRRGLAHRRSCVPTPDSTSTAGPTRSTASRCWPGSLPTPARSPRPVNVLVEFGATGGRCGARTLDEAIAVGHAISRSPQLALAGVAGYEGALGHDRSTGAVGRIEAYLDDLGRLHTALAELMTPESLITAGGSAYPDLVAAAFGSHRSDRCASCCAPAPTSPTTTDSIPASRPSPTLSTRTTPSTCGLRSMAGRG